MIILLRHGESTDVADGLVSGQRDVPLTETGRFQAAKAAWAIVRYGITRIVSSDLVRAEETAKIIARELGLPPPQRDPRFRERNWGECQGQPKGNKSPLAADEAPQGGESYDEFYARVIAAFSGISAATLIVTHAGPIRCILSDCSLPPDTLTPCQFVCVPCRSKKEARRPDSPDKNIYHLYGGTISPGELSGKAVYVSGFEDVPKCTADSLLLLGNCSKDAAVEAMRCNAPAVNLTGALTAHLTCGRVTFAPFAVARSWPDGLPPEGEEITIEIINNEVNETLPPLPDITLRGSADVQRVGGKGAGLVMLEELGFRVPDFLLVDTEQAAAWMKSESPLEDAVLWCRKRLKNPRTRWAVRSNANVEDGGNDAMSGSFESLLDLVPEQVPGAILRIIQSCDNAEIRQRLQSGALTEIPKMAIVIQKMVENILFSGTVFSPAPDNPCVIHLEAVLETTGDTLMDGTRRADISARFDAFANLLDLTMADQSLYQKIEPLVKQTAREALAIYHSTGRGDVEFSVDRDGRCWWLQARPLNTMFVMVDRCNFHALPKKYYQEIAFRVMEANRMPSVYFRLISPPGGMFGYSVGILRRDILFRLMLQKDPCHLEAVTQFGWQVTRDIEKMISAPEQYSLDELFNKLVLHGAVQAPFSIPMSASRKERHQSWTVGETNVSGYLE
ncbi:MAG: histidine phosphatase family protein, partial [Treponema sp.]|nr:histidine phosphatase family protein [Treponema sp.]